MRSVLLFAGCLACLAACAPTVPAEQVPPPPPPSGLPAGAEAQVPPGFDVNATAACVRENATEGELALMALGGERAQSATAQVLGRPETLACLNRSGVALPGAPAS